MKQINRFKIYKVIDIYYIYKVIDINELSKRLNIKVKIIKRYHAQKQIILLLSQNRLLVHNACEVDTYILLVSNILFF